jgi:hypothetical protein
MEHEKLITVLATPTSFHLVPDESNFHPTNLFS